MDTRKKLAIFQGTGNSQQKYPSAVPSLIFATEVSGFKQTFLQDKESNTKTVFKKQNYMQLTKHITLIPQM